MPSSDTVIVDFDSLQNAISSFKTTSGQIADLEARLQANASQLQGAWRSNASDAYSERMAKLAANFQRASTRLEEEGQELNRLYQLEWEAEQQARTIAQGVSDYTLL